MDRYDIGGFATWEKNDDGEAVIRYRDDNVKRLRVRNLDIVNVIIECSIKYDTFITAQEIADTLNCKYGKPEHTRDTIKHALKRIREKEEWRGVIVSSSTGYLIKCTAISSEPEKALVLDDSPKASDDTNTEDLLPAPIPVPKGKAPIIDTSPVLIEFPRYEAYIHNFISDNQKVRTYFYKNSPRDVFDVMQPLSLESVDGGSSVDISFRSLHNSNEEHRYIVSGPIGSGKSLLARKIALEAAHAFPQCGVIPVLYDLASFSDTEKSLFEILKDEYESYIPGEDTDPFSAFTACCQNGSVLLLIDGLDMIDTKLREQFVRKLKAFLRSYSNNNVVIFSRPTDSFNEFDSFSVLRLKPLLGKEPLNMVDYLLSSEDDDDLRILKNYVFDLQDRPLFRATLYGNPLYISIICFENRYILPFFDLKACEFIEELIKYVTDETRSVQNKRVSKCLLSRNEFHEELCDLCFYLVLSSCYYFDANNVYDCWTAFNVNKRFTAHDFLDDLCRKYGLIRFKDGKYEFIDDQIVSYFYSKRLVETGIELKSIRTVIRNNASDMTDSILDMLYEMDSYNVSRKIYRDYFKANIIDDSYGEYEDYLVKFFPTIKYYVGEEGYEVENERDDAIYCHLVKDWGVAQDINHLPFPPLDSLNKLPVFRISDSVPGAKGLRVGLINQNEKTKPVGYIYKFNMEDIFDNTDETSNTIRDILMSDDFPLYNEFYEVLKKCESYWD